MRAETGYIQFEGDWRGVFLRGDTSFGLMQDLTLVGRAIPKDCDNHTKMALHRIEKLCELLRGVSQHDFPNKEVKLLRNIADCQRDG